MCQCESVLSGCKFTSLKMRKPISDNFEQIAVKRSVHCVLVCARSVLESHFTQCKTVGRVLCVVCDLYAFLRLTIRHNYISVPPVPVSYCCADVHVVQVVVFLNC